MRGILAQLNVSGGGMPKKPIEQAMVNTDGVQGDWQKNRKYHGGPNRAICLYSEELYQGLRDSGVSGSADLTESLCFAAYNWPLLLSLSFLQMSAQVIDIIPVSR